MKKDIILSAIIIFAITAVSSVSSCKKKTDTVIKMDTVTQHDTVKNYITTSNPTIIGTWTDNSSSHPNPIFTHDSVSWGGGQAYRYVASPDTVYSVTNLSYFTAQYAYSITPTNDTLTLTTIPISTGTGPTVRYWRIN